MIKVLVVDDDFMVANIHKGFTEQVPGFTVAATAHTGAEALAAAERVRPDLVLLDIYLPDMSGLEVLRRLRERNSDIDVLAITAASDVDTVRTALRGGVVHYLIKPFTFATLRDRLERYAAAVQGLDGTTHAAQSDVDRLFGTLRPDSATLPKGLSAATADLVIGALRDSDAEVSAAECAIRTGLSRVAARRYLEYLVQSGKATVRMRYGTGRPVHCYRWVR
jgi:two-component system CitB family response regulator